MVVKKKRYILLVLGSILIALVALSPFLLSSSSALHFFIAAVNRNISGKLSIDSWLIGWQQGVLCQNVVYTNPEKGIMVAVPSLTSNRGLIALVLAPKNLGIVHAESPVVELSGPALRDFFAQGKTGASEAGIHAAGNEVPVWDRLFVDLKARGGQVKIGLGGQGLAVDLNNVSVDATLAVGVAAFAIRFQAMEQGFVEASGTLNLPAHEHGWLETIIADTEVKVSSLQVRELLRAAAAASGLPQGEGVLAADFKLKVVGLDGIDYSGLAELSDCTLSGGFLGDDQPSFQKVRLAVEEGGWTTHGWRLNGFELVSDTLTMQASGKVSPETTQLTAQGIINLPVLFDQIPRLLRVNEATFLESGTVEFTVDLPGAPDPGIKLKAKADQIGGIFQDQPFFWDSPVSLLLNGEKKGAALQVSALQFEAPFAGAKGSGGLHSFAMEAVLDLERAFADIGTLFQFDLTGSGKMDLTMKSAPAKKDRFTVSGDLDISDFMLLRHDQSLIPRHQFSLIGSLTAPDSFADRRQGEWDIQLALSSWLGEVFLAMNGEKTEGQPFKGYYTTDSELDLARTTSLLHAMNILGSETRMAGTLQMQAAGFAGHSPVEIRDLSAEITDFTLEGNGAHFTEPRVTLAIIQPVNEEVSFLSLRELKVVADKETFFRSGAGLNLLDISAHQVTLHNVQLQAQALTGVKRNDSLVSHLLSKIHPLFGGLATPSGLIDVRLDSLWWPIGEKGANPANFVVIVDAREILLESSIQLKNILVLFGLEKEKLQLRNNEIYCIGNNGRIKCSPLRVMANGAEIIIGGSVGMDRSLDYEVEVPITNKLVRDEESEVPPGETVKVAVKGTSEKPIFDRQAVLSAIQSSMQQAASETGKKKKEQN